MHAHTCTCGTHAGPLSDEVYRLPRARARTHTGGEVSGTLRKDGFTSVNHESAHAHNKGEKSIRGILTFSTHGGNPQLKPPLPTNKRSLLHSPPADSHRIESATPAQGENSRIKMAARKLLPNLLWMETHTVMYKGEGNFCNILCQFFIFHIFCGFLSAYFTQKHPPVSPNNLCLMNVFP